MQISYNQWLRAVFLFPEYKPRKSSRIALEILKPKPREDTGAKYELLDHAIGLLQVEVRVGIFAKPLGIWVLGNEKFST